MRFTGTHFAGAMLSRILAPGTAKFVACVEIGESGIATTATSALMESLNLANIVATPREYFALMSEPSVPNLFCHLG